MANLRRVALPAAAALGLVAMVGASCSGPDTRPTGDAQATSTTSPSTPSSSITSTSTTSPSTVSEPPASPDPELAWVDTMSGPSRSDEIDGVAATDDGGAWVTGQYRDSVRLGDEEFSSAGLADIPLARFEPDGSPRWVTSFGGPGEDNFFDIVAVPDGGAVATGYFSDTVDFGGQSLASLGETDCVIAAFDDRGGTEWAIRLGGTGRDGCNEVDVGPDGSVVTTVDTEGGWTLPAGGDPRTGPEAPAGTASSVLVRLDGSGEVQWSRLIQGDRRPRSKALSVGPDGSIVLGGDTVGAVSAGGTRVPAPGSRRDAWLSRWSPGGDMEWLTTWGGPGDDLAKGVLEDADGIYVVGEFTGSVQVGGAELNAVGLDLAVVRLRPDGSAQWATSVTSPADLVGAEVTAAPGGGILFGNKLTDSLSARSVTGADAVADGPAGAAYLARYDAAGTPTVWTVPGAVDARVGELDQRGGRVILDVVVSGEENRAGLDGPLLGTSGRDASVWALDLAG